MSKLLHPFVILLLAATPLTARAVTLEFGALLNAAKLSTTTTTRDITADSNLGFGAGILCEGKPFSSQSLSTEIGLLYAQRAYGYGTLTSFTTTWIMIPLMERIAFGSFSLGVGGYFAKAMGEVKATDSAGTTTSSTYEANDTGTSDYGLVASLRWASGSLFADIRVQKGLSDVSTQEGVSEKFTDMLLLLGIRY